MFTKPGISVVLPVRNAEHTIVSAAESILNQTHSEFELVIVDDGSTDQTPVLLNGLANRDPRITLITQKPAGIVAALNRGIGRSNAPLIARMDADDISLPERLEKQAEYMDRNPEIGLAGCRVRFGGDSKKAAGYHRYVKWTNTMITPEQIANERFVESPFAHPSVIFRRRLVMELGGYQDGDFPEDYELWLRWMQAGVKMGKVDEDLLIWSDPPGRLSRTDSRYRKEAFYRIKAVYLAQWLEKQNPNHPEVVIWGGGRVTRRRADFLLEAGISVKSWVDIHPGRIGKKIAGIPVLSPDELPDPGNVFVIPYVGSAGAREQIIDYLEARGYRAGIHYISAA